MTIDTKALRERVNAARRTYQHAAGGIEYAVPLMTLEQLLDAADRLAALRDKLAYLETDLAGAAEACRLLHADKERLEAENQRLREALPRLVTTAFYEGVDCEYVDQAWADSAARLEAEALAAGDGE